MTEEQTKPLFDANAELAEIRGKHAQTVAHVESLIGEVGGAEPFKFPFNLCFSPFISLLIFTAITTELAAFMTEMLGFYYEESGESFNAAARDILRHETLCAAATVQLERFYKALLASMDELQDST
ncbi:hypothetical protein HDU77_007078 [Chytriomyces hyalinus]|nr:hypothetical protein HDU77_007078 [Chytriomyces hyalinus]